MADTVLAVAGWLLKFENECEVAIGSLPDGSQCLRVWEPGGGPVGSLPLETGQ